MEEQIREEDTGFLRGVLFILKRNLILVIAVILVALGCGVGYSYMVKPSYTASERLSFQARVLTGSSIAYNVNAMNAYVETVVDFCDEGVVLDRANFYYKAYLSKKADGMTFNEFCEGLDSYVYDPDTKPKNDSFFKSNVNVSMYDKNDGKFVFLVKYTDGTVEKAMVKTQLLAYSFSREVKEQEGTDGKYFSGFVVEIKNLGYEGYSSNVSKTKIVLVAGIIGVLASAVLVYVKNLLDNTYNNKDDIERETSLKLLAMINNEGGTENGK